MKKWSISLCLFISTGILSLTSVYTLSYAKAVAASGKTGAPLAILMYHQLSTDSGRYSEHVLPKDAFEADIAALLSRGFTPITAEQLIEYCCGTGTLPDKAVMITFDDGNLSFYTHAYPILQKYGIPAVLSPVARWVEKETNEESPTEYLSVPQIQEMLASGLIELGNHSYDMHNVQLPRRGVLKRKEETFAQYEGTLTDDLLKAQRFWQENVGVTPDVFTYPYGFCNTDSEDIIAGMGFSMTFGCWERLNWIADSSNLSQLGRFNRPGGVSSDEFIQKIADLYP